MEIYRGYEYLPLSFIGKLSNLQVITLLLGVDSYDFKSIQHVTFSNLHILKFPIKPPKLEYLVNFLKINANNLKELYISVAENQLNLSIAQFCPNLKHYVPPFRDVLKR